MPNKIVYCGRCRHKYSCKQNFDKHFDTYLVHDQSHSDQSDAKAGAQSWKKSKTFLGAQLLTLNLPTFLPYFEDV